jgi:HlyD family secretion protein
MDIARETRRRPSALRYALPGVAAVAVVAAGAWSLPALLQRSAPVPAVDRAGLVLDIARRGTLVRAVTAAGQLVPDRVQVVATTADGLIDDVRIHAGSRVAAGDVVAVLDNPDLAAAVVDVRAQLEAARADVRSAREDASATQLDQQAAYGTALAAAKRSNEEAHSYASLHSAGLISDLSFRETLIRADADQSLAGIARRKIDVDAAGDAAKIAAAVAKVEQLQAQLAARQAQVETLVVRAGSAGIVQSVAVEPGQRVTSGTEIARIAEARDLKAVLQVAESDVRGISLGMPASIASDGVPALRGHVARIAPAAQSGTVPVDVSLENLPAGLRPDQNVDGTIELSRARDVVSIARPAGVSDDSTVSLYRVSADGSRAFRIPVRLGSGSLDRIRVLAGLAPGDTVIVSDTSADTAPQLRIQ